MRLSLLAASSLLAALALSAAASEPDLDPHFRPRCEQGEAYKVKLPPTFTQGRCCYLVAKNEAKSDVTSALGFAHKACELRDSLGCSLYSQLAADPGVKSADFVKARELLTRICTGEKLLDARKSHNDTGQVCFDAARALFSPDMGQSWPVEQREKIEAKKLLDAACKAENQEACAVVTKMMAPEAAAPPPEAKVDELPTEWPEHIAEAFASALNQGKTGVAGPLKGKVGGACASCPRRCAAVHMACQASDASSVECFKAAKCVCGCLQSCGGCGYPKALLDSCQTDAGNNIPN